MNVLVACEFSAVVRDAFRAKGHNAWSCDLLDCEGDPKYHHKGDVFNYLDSYWDLLIAHPECTYLCNSGVRWLKPKGITNTARLHQMKEACRFFASLYNSPVDRIAVENPIMHKYAKEELLKRGVPSHNQIIQPWQYGHGEVKATCLWLKNLPKLEPTCIVSGREPRVHHASPGPDRWKERSRTLPGIARAMSEQWGGLNVL